MSDVQNKTKLRRGWLWLLLGLPAAGLLALMAAGCGNLNVDHSGGITVVGTGYPEDDE